MEIHKDMPIRIPHVFGIMNCGGAETFIMNVYRNIDRRKIQFDFIVHSHDKGYYDDEIKELGGRKYVVPKFKGGNIFNYIKVWKEFLEVHNEYGIIHSHIRSTASIFLGIARRKGLKTIIHSHSISSGSGLLAYIKNSLQFPLKYITDYRFACSDTAGRWLFGKKDFVVIKNAIKSEEYTYNQEIRNDYRDKLGIEGKFVVGHIGRFCEPKNHLFIIDIFKSIFDRDSNSVLLLVGDGDLRNEIHNRVKELSLEDNVIFTGIRKDISGLLQVMDIFLFPSLYEGLGIVLIEAQASGLTCIVSDTIPEEVAITDLVEFISLRRSAEEWAEHILKYNKYNERKNTSEMISNRGYEIKEQVGLLESFYVEQGVKQY